MSVNETLLPREKALEYGIGSLENDELLALILKSAYREKNVLELAQEIIDRANGFHNLPSMTYEELTQIKGVKKAKALEIMAVLEFSKRLVKIEKISEADLNAPAKVVDWLRMHLGYSTEEEFIAVFLNGRGGVLRFEKLYQGNRTSSSVGVDTIMRKAILYKASYLLVAHNHPSDRAEPSDADIDLTEKLYQSARMLGIPLLDHIIIGKTSYFSFRNQSMLK